MPFSEYYSHGLLRPFQVSVRLATLLEHFVNFTHSYISAQNCLRAGRYGCESLTSLSTNCTILCLKFLL